MQSLHHFSLPQGVVFAFFFPFTFVNTGDFDLDETNQIMRLATSLD
jgi:hypothetical protein